MAAVTERFVFFKFQHLYVVSLESGHLNNVPNERQRIILAVISKM